MTTFVLICLSIMAVCSIIMLLVILSAMEDITNFLQSINVKLYQIESEVHYIYFCKRSKRTSKQEKIRKKHSCYNERDLK